MNPPTFFPMSKNLFSQLLVCLALTTFSISLAQSNQGLIRLTRINTQVFVEDNVSKTREEKLEEVKITENNTVVTTGPASRVILVFSNGATINLAADSILNIEQFQQDPFGGEYSIKDATDARGVGGEREKIAVQFRLTIRSQHASGCSRHSGHDVSNRLSARRQWERFLFGDDFGR